MDAFSLFIILLIAVVIAVGVIVVLSYRKIVQKKAHLVNLLEGLGFQRDAKRRFLTFHDGMDGTLNDRGRSFGLHVRYPSRNTPGWMRLDLVTQAGTRFRVEYRSKVANFFGGLGLGNSLRTSDENFDSSFRITTDDEAYAAFCFCHEEVREAVTALFKARCCSVECKNGELRADWRPFRVLDRSPIPYLECGISHLSELAAALPCGLPVGVGGHAQGVITQSRFDFLVVFAWILLGASLMGLIFLTKFNFPMDEGHLFFLSLKASLPVLAFFAISAGLAIRNKTWFSGAALKLIPIVLSIPLFGWLGAVQMNAWFDTSQTVSHMTMAVKLYEQNNKHTSYHVSGDSGN